MQEFTDRMNFADARVRKTSDGYMVAAPRVARTGIQTYLGDEVGKPDMERVRVYRPEAEVFRRDAFSSIAHRPVTIEHPSESVTADNWKQFAVGQTDGGIVRDGEYVRVSMMLMDNRAIKLVEDGDKLELSLGYSADLDFTPGQTPAGEHYDAVQRNIRVNHLALVSRARGGSALRIGDSYPANHGDSKMAETKLVLDGITISLSDTAAEVVNKTIATLTKQVKDAEDAFKAFESKKKKTEEEMDDAKKQCDAANAKVVTLEQQLKDAQLTPEKLDGLVAARVDTVSRATKILGDKLVIQGKTDGEIRRQVVDAKLGDKAKGWSEDAVKASFETITDAQAGTNTLSDASRAFSNPSITDKEADQTEAAYAEYNKRLGDAWKGSK